MLAAAALAFASAVIVYRYLPRSLAPSGPLHGPLESFEDAAELGLGGTPPVFADHPAPAHSRDASSEMGSVESHSRSAT